MELALHIWTTRLGNLRIGYAIKRELLTMNMYGLTEFRHGIRMLIFCLGNRHDYRLENS